MDDIDRTLAELYTASLGGHAAASARVARMEAKRQAHIAQGRHHLAAETEVRMMPARWYLSALEAEEQRHARERAMAAALGAPTRTTLGSLAQADFDRIAAAVGWTGAAGTAERLLDRYPFLTGKHHLHGLLGTHPALSHAIQEAEEARRRAAEASRHWDEARRLAELSAGFGLAGPLSAFVVDPRTLAERIALLGGAFQGHWADPVVAAGLARTSALSNMLAVTGRVDADVLRAAGEFRAVGLPGVTDTALARAMLDAGGLHARRLEELLFPPQRLLRLPPSKGEKRKALLRLKKRAKPSRAHQTAHRLIGSTEVMLRRVVARAMEFEYGPNWERERLPQCDCSGLLRKASQAGGPVLDHADWAHYRRIMCHPDHFSAVFALGFGTPADLEAALEAVRQDRAAVAHYRAFTPNRLASLRGSCRTLEDGLMEMLHPLGLAEDEEDAEGDEA